MTIGRRARPRTHLIRHTKLHLAWLCRFFLSPLATLALARMACRPRPVVVGIAPDLQNLQVARSYRERVVPDIVVQGSAADLMKLALIRLNEILPAAVCMLLPVHDSILLNVPEGLVEETRQIVTAAMESLPESFTVPAEGRNKDGQNVGWVQIRRRSTPCRRFCKRSWPAAFDGPRVALWCCGRRRSRIIIAR